MAHEFEGKSLQELIKDWKEVNQSIETRSRKEFEAKRRLRRLRQFLHYVGDSKSKGQMSSH